MQLPYKTKQNQQNNKNKVENDIIVEVIVCHCCRFGCCCFDVVSNQNQNKHMQNIYKHYTKQNKNKPTKQHSYTYYCYYLFLFILLAPKSQKESLNYGRNFGASFFGSKVAKRIL